MTRASASGRKICTTSTVASADVQLVQCDLFGRSWRYARPDGIGQVAAPSHGSRWGRTLKDVQIGVFTAGDLQPSEIVALAIAADEAGFDVFAVGEHHNPPYTSSCPATLLAHIAARTTLRLSIGRVWLYHALARDSQRSCARTTCNRGRSLRHLAR